MGLRKNKGRVLFSKQREMKVLIVSVKKYRIVINTTRRMDTLNPSYLRGIFYTRYVENIT